MGISLVQLVIEILIFILLVFGIKAIYKRIKTHELLNLQEYLPEEEIHTIRQVFYLIIMTLCFINILYSITFTTDDIIYLTIFDCVLSLFCAVNLDSSTLKNKIIMLLLIPYGSLTYIMFGMSMVSLLDLIHIPIFIYMIKVYYDKFNEYTLSNGLGISILLLFAIMIISLFVTTLSEGVNLLDALVMSSNAFTSNGYAILGHTILGKLDALLLVWGGYVLSGVGTATLCSAILIRHYNKRFDELERLIKENKKD